VLPTLAAILHNPSREARKMRISVCLLAVTALGGCHQAQRDGGKCTQNSDCKSGICLTGYCEGSGCSCSGKNDCISGACEAGWTCKYYPPDPITGTFGNPGSHHCAPQCDSCPPDYSCSSPATDTVCTYTPPMLTVDAGGPYQGAPGQLIRFHATASSPVAPIQSYTWQFGDGDMGTGADVTHVYQAQLWGKATLRVVDQFQDAGETTAVVEICGGAGAGCRGGAEQCCAGTSCNPTTFTCE
jgi:hypothetical protein